MKPQRGTTLIELLVVMSIFAGLMSLILGFYIYAYRVSGSRDRLSTSYRKMLTVMDKIEVMVSNSRVIYENTYQICYLPLNATQPILKGGWPNYMPPQTIAMIKNPVASGNSTLVLRENINGSFQTSTLAILAPGELVVFAGGSLATGSAGTGTYDSINVNVTLNVPVEDGVGIARSYTLTRSILLERP